MERYEGLSEFVLTRGPALSRTAYLLTGDHQLAEDLLQQALAKTAAHCLPGKASVSLAASDR